MNRTTEAPTTITERDVRAFLETALARISPNNSEGIIMASLNVSPASWQMQPSFSFTYSGCNIGHIMATTLDKLAVAVAAKTPAAKALRRREELTKELAQLDAMEAKEVQS